MTALLVALGAAVGAPLRYVLTRLDGVFPAGMLAVNVLGSGLFGVFAALSLGVVPFLLGDVIKVVVAATIAPSLVHISR